MIDVNKFFSVLKKNNIDFFCGVPDSILKKTNSHFSNFKKENHIILHNEGGAVATAAGYALRTKKIPCVYLQNSGLGNIVNPVLSLVHKKVYSIPILFLIGWRGSPGKKDEPQHTAQGKKTLRLLSLLDIEYLIIKNDSDLNKIGAFIKKNFKNKKSSALLVEKNTFSQKKGKPKVKINYPGMLRHEVIEYIIKKKQKNLKIFSTTGYTSRELYQLRKLKNSNIIDFYNVGAMGHTNMISLGYSLSNKNKILCLDGDGSLLMHMGGMAVISHYGGKNFKHILFNNQQHESVGGQLTPIKNVDFKLLSKGAGYKNYFFCKNLGDFKKKYKKFISSKGPSFFEIRVKSGTLNELGRPKDFAQIKKKFQNS